MSEAPRLSLLPSQEARQAYLDDVPEQHRDVPRRAWHYLLRPKFIETSVAIIDFLLIVTASIACSALYYALTDGRIAAALPYAGVGLIVSVNFAAIMTARRNYRLKVLTLFAKQARDTIVIWS